MISNPKIKQYILAVSAIFLLLLSSLRITAQIKSTTIQQLNFGSFCANYAGGTICISPAGARTLTGDIITLNEISTLYAPAIIEVEAPIGSRIVIVDANTQLIGSNGKTVMLRINGSEPASPFITRTAKTSVSIGGILTVGNPTATPSGKYSGTFFLTFVVE